MKGKGNRELNSIVVVTPEGTNETNINSIKFLIIQNNKYKGLLKTIANESTLLSAFKRIIKKKGYYTKNVIDEILTVVDKQFFIGLSKELGSGCYQPKPSRRLLIPKSNGGTRSWAGRRPLLARWSLTAHLG